MLVRLLLAIVFGCGCAVTSAAGSVLQEQPQQLSVSASDHGEERSDDIVERSHKLGNDFWSFQSRTQHGRSLDADDASTAHTGHYEVTFNLEGGAITFTIDRTGPYQMVIALSTGGKKGLKLKSGDVANFAKHSKALKDELQKNAVGDYKKKAAGLPYSLLEYLSEALPSYPVEDRVWNITHVTLLFPGRTVKLFRPVDEAGRRRILQPRPTDRPTPAPQRPRRPTRRPTRYPTRQQTRRPTSTSRPTPPTFTTVSPSRSPNWVYTEPPTGRPTRATRSPVTTQRPTTRSPTTRSPTRNPLGVFTSRPTFQGETYSPTKYPTTRTPTRFPASPKPTIATKSPTRWRCTDEFLSTWNTKPNNGFVECPVYTSVAIKDDGIACLCPYTGGGKASAYYDGRNQFASVGPIWEVRKVKWRLFYGPWTSDCIGRCGPGCNRFDKEATKDCLEHDTCIEHFGGSSLSDSDDCANEFWDGTDDTIASFGIICPLWC